MNYPMPGQRRCECYDGAVELFYGDCLLARVAFCCCCGCVCGCCCGGYVVGCSRYGCGRGRGCACDCHCCCGRCCCSWAAFWLFCSCLRRKSVAQKVAPGACDVEPPGRAATSIRQARSVPTTKLESGLCGSATHPRAHAGALKERAKAGALKGD